MVDFTLDAIASDNDVLLASAKAGCADSINAVLSRCRGNIHSLVFGYLGRWKRSIDAEDVTQFVLYEVFKSLSACKANTWADFRRYLMTISRNKTLNFIEKMQTQKRGGRFQIKHLGDADTEVAGQSDNIAESQDLDELIYQLETIASSHPTHRAVLDSFIDGTRIDGIALATGKPRKDCYPCVKRFRRDARAIVERRYDSDLVEAVKDDLMTGKSRRSMRNCYGLLPSDLDAIEVS